METQEMVVSVDSAADLGAVIEQLQKMGFEPKGVDPRENRITGLMSEDIADKIRDHGAVIDVELASNRR